MLEGLPPPLPLTTIEGYLIYSTLRLRFQTGFHSKREYSSTQMQCTAVHLVVHITIHPQAEDGSKIRILKLITRQMINSGK
jgi:hypothetical protein